MIDVAMFGHAEAVFIQLILRPTIITISSGLILAFGYSLLKGTASYREKLARNIVPAFGYSVPTVFVAYIAGYLTGASRAPAVANVVPAVLTLLGGLNIYFFGIESINRAIVGYSVFAFALVFFYAVQVGGINREMDRVERLIQLSDQEKEIHTYRANRGLAPDPPAWLLGGEPK